MISVFFNFVRNCQWARCSGVCIYNPSHSGGRDWRISWAWEFRASLDSIARSCLKEKKKRGLEVWLKHKSTCLASVKPWVQTPVLKKREEKKEKKLLICFHIILSDYQQWRSSYFVSSGAPSFVSFSCTGVWTQGLRLARQVIYHLSYFTSPVFDFFAKFRHLGFFF
jgi:hypothetical protein